MHFEILVEDTSGKTALELLFGDITGGDSTCRLFSYRGIGAIPKGLKDPKDASKRILLNNLPKLLRGYGRQFPETGVLSHQTSVIVVCDLDDRDYEAFIGELQAILDSCDPRPAAHFCLAIEEGEAWLLGDLPAIRAAYPRAKTAVLERYENDSICGTWEMLADAVYPGGSHALARQGGKAVGAEKSKWAERIPLYMMVDGNLSPSFCAFRDKIREQASRRGE